MVNVTQPGCSCIVLEPKTLKRVFANGLQHSETCVGVWLHRDFNEVLINKRGDQIERNVFVGIDDGGCRTKLPRVS